MQEGRAFGVPFLARGDRPSSLSMALLSATVGLLALTSAIPALAADGGLTSIIRPGSMAVSGFPSTFIPGIDEGLPPGVNPVDETFIDTSRASLRIFDVLRSADRSPARSRSSRNPSR